MKILIKSRKDTERMSQTQFDKHTAFSHKEYYKNKTVQAAHFAFLLPFTRQF